MISAEEYKRRAQVLQAICDDLLWEPTLKAFAGRDEADQREYVGKLNASERRELVNGLRDRDLLPDWMKSQ